VQLNHNNAAVYGTVVQTGMINVGGLHLGWRMTEAGRNVDEPEEGKKMCGGLARGGKGARRHTHSKSGDGNEPVLSSAGRQSIGAVSIAGIDLRPSCLAAVPFCGGRDGNDPRGDWFLGKIDFRIDQMLAWPSIERRKCFYADLEWGSAGHLYVLCKMQCHLADEVRILRHHHLLPRRYLILHRKPLPPAGRWIESKEFRIARFFGDHDLPGAIEFGASPRNRLGREVRAQRKEQLDCRVQAKSASKKPV